MGYSSVYQVASVYSKNPYTRYIEVFFYENLQFFMIMWMRIVYENLRPSLNLASVWLQLTKNGRIHIENTLCNSTGEKAFR